MSGGSYDAFVIKVNPTGDTVVYKGYLGGLGEDWGQGVAIAPNCPASCEAYVVGRTDSGAFFPKAGGLDNTHNGGMDAFALKVKPDGTGLVWSGFIGGSQDDSGTGMPSTRQELPT